MGQSVEPRYKGLSIHIPVMMVTSRGYEILRARSHVSIRYDGWVNSTYWSVLEKIIVEERKGADVEAVLLKESSSDSLDR